MLPLSPSASTWAPAAVKWLLPSLERKTGTDAGRMEDQRSRAWTEETKPKSEPLGLDAAPLPALGNPWQTKCKGGRTALQPLDRYGRSPRGRPPGLHIALCCRDRGPSPQSRFGQLEERRSCEPLVEIGIRFQSYPENTVNSPKLTSTTAEFLKMVHFHFPKLPQTRDFLY